MELVNAMVKYMHSHISGLSLWESSSS